jgi:class 3 adenylate cyclase
MHETNQQPKFKSWFSEQNLSWSRGLLIALLVGTAFAFFHSSDAGYSIEHRFFSRLMFSARDALGYNPPTHPKLKVLVFDDLTVKAEEAGDLSPAQWASLIESISRHSPARIVFDKRFGGKIDNPGDRSALKSAIKNAGNVIIGGHAEPVRNDENLSTGLVDPSKYQIFAPIDFVTSLPSAANPRLANIVGPTKVLLDDIYRIGTTNNDDFGFYLPFYRVRGGGAILQLSLSAFEDVRFVGRDLQVNGTNVGLTRYQTLIPNYLPMRSVADKSHFMSIARYMKFGNESGLRIEKDDVVLVILNFFTSGTDFKDTPAGTLVGGLMIASVLNDGLHAKFVDPIDLHFVWIILIAFASVPLVILLSGLKMWSVFATISAGMMVIGVTLFLTKLQLLPLLWTLGPFATSFLICFLEKARVSEHKTRVLKISLSDKLSPFHLQKLTGQPPTVDSHAYQRDVSLMFIDVVGYSRYAEQENPESVFADLRSLISQLTLLIYEHNGSVNNSFGDGLLAVFGYYFDGKNSSENHADDALRCAIAIQKAMVLRNFEASQKNKAVHPLRIGINTGTVCVGDLAEDDRFNFTVIGHAVNYAKRLEEACEFYRVMFGTNTMVKLKQVDSNHRAISKRLVLIKHRDEPLEAFEFDPLVDDPELSLVVHKQYWKFAGVSQREDRISVPAGLNVSVQTNYGPGRLANFSREGLALDLKSYLANGMMVEFSLNSEDGKLGDSLSRANLHLLSGEVRWGSKLIDGYQHGIMLKNMTDAQKEYLFECITETVLSGSRGILRINKMDDAS